MGRRSESQDLVLELGRGLTGVDEDPREEMSQKCIRYRRYGFVFTPFRQMRRRFIESFRLVKRRGVREMRSGTTEVKGGLNDVIEGLTREVSLRTT